MKTNDLWNLATAIRYLPHIFGEQEQFEEEFDLRSREVINEAKKELNRSEDMLSNFEFGPKGESLFNELKQWVINNYPFPKK